jgi:hypothetical protein
VIKKLWQKYFCRPVFTVSEPGFMGSSEARNHLFIKRMSGGRRMVIDPRDTARFTVYYHGELETLLGYDIPIWLSGRIRVQEDSQKCYVWNYSGTKRVDAVMVTAWNNRENQWLCYICFPNEEKQVAKQLWDHIHWGQ